MTKPTKNKIYDDYVTVTSSLDVILKKCLVNHMLIYNYSLQELYADSEISFKALMKKVRTHIRVKEITTYIDIALMSELYYQYKKFKKNIRIQKLITDIHYFTFISNGYNSKHLFVSPDRLTVRIRLFEDQGEFTLHEPLPELQENELIYFNISYSNAEDRYKISIHKTT